jgi:RND family efflux transporter MFP subunit
MVGYDVFDVSSPCPAEPMPAHELRRRLLSLRWCALLAAIGLLSGCGGDDAASTAAKPELPAIRAEVLAVAPQVWPTMVLSQGTLIADEVATIGAKVSGRVDKVHVDLGDEVKSGSPLVTLDRAEFELHVMQAEAQLGQARAAVGLGPDDPVEKLVPENSPPVREQRALWDESKAKADRYRQLLAQNAVPQIEANQFISAEQVAAARYAAALNGTNEKIAMIHVRASELALARQQLAESVIVAPFDGMIRERLVAPGSFVQVGQSAVTLVRTSALRFRGMMPEVHAQRLALGQEVRLQIESFPEDCVAKVTRISPALDDLSRALLFEAELDNSEGRLRSGLFALASVVLDSKAQAIAVPKSALVEFAGVEKVWKVVDGAAREQTVLTGRRRDGGIEIISGLAAGDVILKDASKGRQARVEIVRTAPAEGGAAHAVAAGPDPPAAADNEPDKEADASSEVPSGP